MSKHKTSEKALKKSGRCLGKLVEKYMAFLDDARTPEYAVEAAARMLDTNGFVKYGSAEWNNLRSQNDGGYALSKRNGLYFVDRNGVNIAAVKPPMYSRGISSHNLKGYGVNIAGAHVDFCTLTNKVTSLVKKTYGAYLDTRPYGWFYAHQWMDRPLEIIGKTLVKTKDGRKQVKWKIQGNIPEPTIHNPKGYKDGTKAYNDMFPLENLDVFTGYKDEKAFLKALNSSLPEGSPKITLEDFNSGFTQFYTVPAEKTQKIGDYIIGYGHDDRACLFSALEAIISVDRENLDYPAIALGVAREEIGSSSVGSANDTFLENVIRKLCAFEHSNLELRQVYESSVMLSADVDIAYTPQNEHVSDKNNCAQFGKGAAIVIANGSSGNPTGNIIMPNDLAYIERFLDKRDLAYQVTALPSKVGIGGGGGTIAEYYSQKGILTADLGVPVGNMHGTTSRIYAADLDSTVECFKALFEREEKREMWG